MRYELLPETIARLERYAAEEMICMSWMTRCKQRGIVNPTWWYASHIPPGNCQRARCKFLRTLDSLKQPAEETLGPSPEGVRAIKAAHALCDELAQVVPRLNAISEHRKLKAIARRGERDGLKYFVNEPVTFRPACSPSRLGLLQDSPRI
jgi:hypothetical protein